MMTTITDLKKAIKDAETLLRKERWATSVIPSVYISLTQVEAEFPHLRVKKISADELDYMNVIAGVRNSGENVVLGKRTK